MGWHWPIFWMDRARVTISGSWAMSVTYSAFFAGSSERARLWTNSRGTWPWRWSLRIGLAGVMGRDDLFQGVRDHDLFPAPEVDDSLGHCCSPVLSRRQLLPVICDARQRTDGSELPLRTDPASPQGPSPWRYSPGPHRPASRGRRAMRP